MVTPLDSAAAARWLLTRTVMLEIANEAFRSEGAQLLGGLFGQVLTDRLTSPGKHVDG